MLLESLEGALHEGKTEQLIVEKLTIQHILPQEWAANWPLPDGIDREVATNQRNGLLHNLGNLTLLTRKLNPRYNGSWDSKIPEILKHSALNLNRALPSGGWGETEIELRGAKLADVAIAIWQYPTQP